MKDYQVLGNLYIPNNEIPLKYDLLLDLVWDWRLPNTVRRIASESWNKVNHWHHDEPWNIGLLLWSNMYPTEFLLPSGQVVTPEPYDLVLVNNNNVVHRVPLEVQRLAERDANINRYMIRGTTRLGQLPTDSTIAEWKRTLRNNFGSHWTEASKLISAS